MQKKSEIGGAEWVDPDDAPELDVEWFEMAFREKNGQVAPPPSRTLQPGERVAVRLHLDVDVADYLQMSGPDWPSRVNAALRRLMDENA